MAGPNYNLNGQFVHANMARNQLMVDMCDGGLVYHGNSSGTRDAVERLNAAHKPYQQYPFDLQSPLF